MRLLEESVSAFRADSASSRHRGAFERFPANKVVINKIQQAAKPSIRLNRISTPALHWNSGPFRIVANLPPDRHIPRSLQECIYENWFTLHENEKIKIGAEISEETAKRHYR
jgi:hypothetical protein